jgi:putative ribosome biogenesis GTPase RsgA
MNILELKSELHELVESINDVRFLSRMLKTFEKAVIKEDIVLTKYALTPEQEAELMISLEESYDEANMVSYEEFKETMDKWLESRKK